MFKSSSYLLVGLDYSKHLLKICDKNLIDMKVPHYKLIHCDATEENYEYGKKLNVYYLYNPFEKPILRQVIKKISKNKCFIIYNNPSNEDVFRKKMAF